MEIIKPFENESYDDYINRIIQARKKKKDGENYQEKHHIIPKCLEGTDEEENLIWLYAQEHLYAHQLLAKENPHNRGLNFAFVAMGKLCKTKRKENIDIDAIAEDYEKAKKINAEIMKEKMTGKNNPCYGLYGELNPNYNRKHTDEERKKMSDYQNNRTEHHKESLKGPRPSVAGENNPNYGKLMTQEQKDKISKARIGKYKGKDHPFAQAVRCKETGEVFESIKQAVEQYSALHIYDCLYGRRKSSGRHPITNEKLHWEKVD